MVTLLLSIFFFCFFLVGLILLWFIWQKHIFYVAIRECSSPFECGFDPKDSARMPFSLRFFFVLILFIIFDVELALVLHLPFFTTNFFKFIRLSLLVFFWVLFLGLVEEWRRGMISWKV